jgi:transglutaminase-like putative cysteine protease
MRKIVFLKVLAAVAAALLASLTVVISLPRPPAQTPVQAKAKTACRYIQPYHPTVQMLAARILMQANTSDLWANLGALYWWIVLNVRYEAEPNGQDYWQTPLETLANGTGDCEDMAILLCSLVLAYRSDLPAECIVIGTASQVAGWAGHVAVAIPFGTDITILDPAGQYYTQTGTVTPVKDGYSVVGGDGRATKKPAAEEVNLWLLGWADKLPNARVACTFSMATEKNFDDTAGFLSWTASTTGGGN